MVVRRKRGEPIPEGWSDEEIDRLCRVAITNAVNSACKNQGLDTVTSLLMQYDIAVDLNKGYSYKEIFEVMKSRCRKAEKLLKKGGRK